MLRLNVDDLTKRLGSLTSDLLRPVKRLTARLGLSQAFLTTIALVVLCLLVFSMLSACTSVRPSAPPQLDPRPMPQFKGRTYRDAMFYVPELQEWGTSCEADKEAVRKALGDE